MPREVTDAAGTKWTLVQAFGGLSDSAAGEAAAERAACAEGHVVVVCTPSGGEQTVRAELPLGWEESASDDELLRAIDSGDRTEKGAAR